MEIFRKIAVGIIFTGLALVASAGDFRVDAFADKSKVGDLELESVQN